MKELGLGVVALSPYGIVGPQGLSAAVVGTLHQAFRAAMQDPSHLHEISKYDQELDYLGPQDYGRAMRETYVAEKHSVERLAQAR
jgi:tripartite-type tricarboxylate transporter receptor subunit TctC